jgi:hypothetical protein
VHWKQYVELVFPVEEEKKPDPQAVGIADFSGQNVPMGQMSAMTEPLASFRSTGEEVVEPSRQ